MSTITTQETAAEVFLTSLGRRDFATIGSRLAPGVQFRLLTPFGLVQEHDADGLVDRLRSWFGDAHPFAMTWSRTDLVGDRASASYRLELGRDGTPSVIEQHLLLDIDAGLGITGVDGVCSGFRARRAPSGQAQAFDAGHLGCADGLAGEFRRRIRAVAVGDSLEVTVRDPAARQDLPPLARMMGHLVRSTEATDDGGLVITIERGR